MLSVIFEVWAAIKFAENNNARDLEVMNEFPYATMKNYNKSMFTL